MCNERQPDRRLYMHYIGNSTQHSVWIYFIQNIKLLHLHWALNIYKKKKKFFRREFSLTLVNTILRINMCANNNNIFIFLMNSLSENC